jgi:hypothetical protein
MPADAHASLRTYAGLFLVTLSTLMLQVLLTRIFSVTLWYHFAFMVVSLAMFGMTLGAVIVYLRPQAFPARDAHRLLASHSLLFAAAIVASFLAQIWIPALSAEGSRIRAFLGEEGWLATLIFFGLIYVVASVPFVFSGIAVCVALTRFPDRVGRLYAADLAGAALGCALLVLLLDWTDGPTAVFAIAGLAALGALCFARDAGRPALVRAAGVAALTLLGFAAVHTTLVWQGRPWLSLRWVKGERAEKPLFERWNAFSYFRVQRPFTPEGAPFGWGFSAALPPVRRVGQLGVAIDACAGTVLTRFDGRFRDLQYLRYDVTNFAHHLRNDADVLVVGVGGGRDVLSALLFDQRSVVGVEINQDLLGALNGRYGDYTGHLDRHPRVRFVVDEARSWVARQEARFDVIQVSLIDTWAATAAGAFVLTENSLYTVEAWEIFLEHLSERGVLSFSRWYVPERAAEMYRLTALGVAALQARGVAEPWRHVVTVTNLGPDNDAETGIGTMLVARNPFSPRDLERIEELAQKLELSVLVAPGNTPDPVFAELVSGADVREVARAFPLDISPPTDDRPFFFNMLRLRDFFRDELARSPVNEFNQKAVATLGSLLALVLGLTLACLLVPLGLGSGRGALRGGLPFLGFFAAIGLGFMFVEISQMQRLIVFLGHPTYGLSVVLFSLLLSAGAGSALAPDASRPGGGRAALTRIALLLGVLGLFGALTPAVTEAFRAQPTPARIALATVLLLPLGGFMGMAFPMGMSLASARAPTLTPWLWGVNGATSVCASVLAVAIAMGAGISASFWTGVGCYALAGLALAAALRHRDA